MTAYIQIIVPRELAREQIDTWFSVVKDNLPSGMIGSTPLPIKDQTKSSNYYHKITNNKKHSYFIPLTRDLDLSEIHQVVESWCQAYPEGDFLIDYSQSPGLRPQVNSLEAGKIAEVLHSWAKHQHQQWMNKRLQQGFKYGTSIDIKNRTHPWIQPWESLPPAARESRLDDAKDLLQILDQFGYEIVQKPIG